MVINNEDTKRLIVAFEKRIEELQKISSENPDLENIIDMEIQYYGRTLIKYKQFSGEYNL